MTNMIKSLTNPDDLQKKSKSKKRKLDELEQNDCRHNLEFIGVPSCNKKDVTQIVMDLKESLNVNIVGKII